MTVRDSVLHAGGVAASTPGADCPFRGPPIGAALRPNCEAPPIARAARDFRSAGRYRPFRARRSGSARRQAWWTQQRTDRPSERQRAMLVRERRTTHHRDTERRLRSRILPPSYVCATRDICVALGVRHRHGDERGNCRAHLRALFHYQGGWQGHGAGLGNRVWHRQAARWVYQRLQ